MILDTLTIMRRLFRSKGINQSGSIQENYQASLNIIMEALNHEYSKVVSEGLRVAGSYVQVLKGQDGSTIDPRFGDVVNPLFNAIKDKLQKTDIDQEVKQCSIIAMASFLTVCHRNLQQQQINGIISVYNERLQNELTRDATLKAITKICLNHNAQDQALISLVNLHTLLPKIFDLLHKAQRTLQLNALEALESMVLRYSQQF